jgi:hypothetical protein
MLAAATIGGSESAAPMVLVAEGADANAGVTMFRSAREASAMAGRTALMLGSDWLGVVGKGCAGMNGRALAALTAADRRVPADIASLGLAATLAAVSFARAPSAPLAGSPA